MTGGYELMATVAENIDIFLILLMRFLGFFMMMPVFSGRNVPAVTRIALCAGCALVVYISGTVSSVQYDPNIFGYAMLMVSEIVVGLIMAFVIYMFLSVFYFVGQLVDFQIGFSMVSVFDPVSQIQVPITGNLYYLVISYVFVFSGALQQVLKTVFYSYTLVPPGKAFLLGNAALPEYALKMMVTYFVLGVKISLPVMATILLVDVALGLLVKAAPQMNIYVVGLPIKLLVGLIVMIAIMPLYASVFNFMFEEMLTYLYDIIKGMIPAA